MRFLTTTDPLAGVREPDSRHVSTRDHVGLGVKYLRKMQLLSEVLLNCLLFLLNEDIGVIKLVQLTLVLVS